MYLFVTVLLGFLGSSHLLALLCNHSSYAPLCSYVRRSTTMYLFIAVLGRCAVTRALQFGRIIHGPEKLPITNESTRSGYQTEQTTTHSGSVFYRCVVDWSPYRERMECHRPCAVDHLDRDANEVRVRNKVIGRVGCEFHREQRVRKSFGVFFCPRRRRIIHL